MWIKQIKVENIRCFEGENTLSFSRGINLLIGVNSSGKSTLISSIGFLEGVGSLSHPLRKTAAKGVIEVSFNEADERLNKAAGVVRGTKSVAEFRYIFPPDGNTEVFTKHVSDAGWSGPSRINARTEITTSHNIFFPFLSRRKSSKIDEAFNVKAANEVRPDFKNLYARLQPLIDSGSEHHEQFVSVCSDLLGFNVNAFPTEAGMSVGLRVDANNQIALTEMGEGVLSIMGMLINIYNRDRCIFLIEELENDLHPGVLKKLLDVILANSERHQFIISTHSSIVLRHLSRDRNAKIFEITPGIRNRIPTSTITEIENTPRNTFEIGGRLGVELSDGWLHEAYLILEEASAESVINEVLIEHHVPSLKGRLKTVSSKGTSGLVRTYNGAQALFLFAHLEPVYKSRCWVRADGDESGKEEISKLRQSFGAGDRIFENYTKPCFEEYYPSRFSADRESAFALSDSMERKAAKNKLLQKVLTWARNNREEAAREFLDSAGEIIADLKHIDACLRRQER
jgi:predicted ATPase